MKREPSITAQALGLGGFDMNTRGRFTIDLRSRIIPYKDETGTLRYVPTGIPGFPDMRLRAAGKTSVVIINMKDLPANGRLSIDGQAIQDDLKGVFHKRANMQITATANQMEYTCTPYQ